MPETRRSGSLTARLLLLAVGIGVSWLLLETAGFAGLVDYRHLLLPPSFWEASENPYHPTMRMLRPSHMHAVGEVKGNIAAKWRIRGTPSHPYDLQYDRHGLRNAEDLTQADVVVLGDSYIESVLTPRSELMTSTLARSTGLDVANIALSGWGPGEQLAALREIGAPLHPHVVVWTFFEGNDPENLQEYRRWVAGGRKPPEPPTRWSFARSAGMALRLWRAGPAELAETLSARFRTTSGEEIPVWFFGPPRSDLDEAFFTSFAEVMTEAHAETLEMHARLVFAFVPRKFRVYRDVLEIPPGSLLRDWPIGDLPERMRDLVASVSPEIGFVDLTPALSAAAARGEMVFFPDDSHWTVAGNRVVADVLAEVVRAPGGAAP